MEIALISAENDPKLLWSCSLNGEKAGNLGAIPVELKLNSRRARAGWAIDFSTLPGYRRKGIGSALVGEANKRFDLFLAVGATDMSFSLFSKMGWRHVGELPHYLKIWDLRGLIRKKINNNFISALLSVPGYILLAIFNFFKRPHKVKGIKVERMDYFGREADLFWSRIENYYRVVVPRDSAYLVNKYDKQPGLQYVKFRASRGGNVCGYAVARCVKSQTSDPEGLITDIIVRPDDREAMRALVSTVLRYLRSEGCSLARAYFSDKEIQRALAESGFLRHKSQMRFLVNKNIDGCEEVYTLGNWYLSAGDSDIERA